MTNAYTKRKDKFTFNFRGDPKDAGFALLAGDRHLKHYLTMIYAEEQLIHHRKFEGGIKKI